MGMYGDRPFFPGQEDKRRLPSMTDAGFATTLGCTYTGNCTGALTLFGILAIA
jgi:hypothetical protein